MTTPTPVMNDEQALKTLEELKRRWNALRDRKIRGQADIQRLRTELDAACKEAEEKFGTSDLDQLRAMVVEVRTANAEATQKFEASLNEAEARLNDIANAA
mgnify:CR=1 FL=1